MEWCPAALATARDSDKVRANGVRALGNLLAFAPMAGGGGAPSDRPPGLEDAWLAEALRCLADALARGSAKVQWNACYAAGSLFRNKAAAAAAACCPGSGALAERGCTAEVAMLPTAGDGCMLQGLLSQLLAILRDSANYKARGPCWPIFGLMAGVAVEASSG